MPDSVGTLFFKDKQVRLMLTLMDQTKEWHIADLARQSGVTYLHTSKFVSKCEEHGIMTSEKHGRIKRIILTKKGEEVARSLMSINEKINVKTPAQEQAQAPPTKS